MTFEKDEVIFKLQTTKGNDGSVDISIRVGKFDRLIDSRAMMVCPLKPPPSGIIVDREPKYSDSIRVERYGWKSTLQDAFAAAMDNLTQQMRDDVITSASYSSTAMVMTRLMLFFVEGQSPGTLAQLQAEDERRNPILNAPCRRESKIRTACQTLMTQAYFGFPGADRKQKRYDMVLALSEELLGYKVDYERLT